MADQRLGFAREWCVRWSGRFPSNSMGVTLMHEHILLDTSSWWKRPCCASDIALSERPLDISMIGELRMNPFLNRDCGLFDVRAAIEGAERFHRIRRADNRRSHQRRNWRDPSALQRISRRTGLHIVMGAGFYLEPSHPEYVKRMSIEAIAEAIAADCGVSEDDPGVSRWNYRRDRCQQRLHAGGGESAARRRARFEDQRGALNGPLARMERLAHRVLDRAK